MMYLHTMLLPDTILKTLGTTISRDIIETIPSYTGKKPSLGV